MATYQYNREELIIGLCKGIKDEEQIVNFIKMLWRGHKVETDAMAKIKWFQIIKKHRAKENLKMIKQGEIDMGFVVAFRNLEKIYKK